MARGKRREAWEHTAALIHWIAATFAGHRVDPESLNPVPRLAAEVLDQAAAAAEAREGWANLRAGLAEISRGWYGGGKR